MLLASRPIKKRLALLRLKQSGLKPRVFVSVGTTVIANDPQRFGANISIPAYGHWALNATVLNNWVADGGMEPTILRYKATASGGDDVVIESNAAGLNKTCDGFFDGAQVRVYRETANGIQLVRVDQVARYLSDPASGQRISLAGSGPVIQAGDVYFLSLLSLDPPLYVTQPQGRDAPTGDSWRLYPTNAANLTRRHDSEVVAPRHNSRASLRLTASDATEAGIAQFITGSPTQHSVNAFDPRQTYRVVLWLKQSGLVDNQIAVWLDPFRAETERLFSVTDNWGEYEITFRGPRRLRPGVLTKLVIAFRGPGILWIDDVCLYNTNQPPYALRPEALHSLRAFRPGTLRIWSGQTNTAWGATLDNWLAPPGQEMRLYEPEIGPAPGVQGNLPTALMLARSCGAAPWLIVSPAFDESEWANLIEYLAGPPTSPYGARRAAHGQERPWSEEFSRIYIEYGNETWFTIFDPWTFSNGALYGKFAERFFAVAKSSPLFPAAQEKISFILGDWLVARGLRSYGSKAREVSRSAAVIAMPAYLSGWERERLPATTREQQFQNTLIYTPAVLQRLLARQIGLRSLLLKMGLPTTLALSEAGPDYPVAFATRSSRPTEERFAKSLAAGVATLDLFLYCAAQGFGPQCYFAYGVGAGWTSHTAWTHGYRPHPAWLALELRNHHAAGAMAETNVAGAPTISVPALSNSHFQLPAQNGIPLVAAYAFRDGARYAIFVISRCLSVSTPITLDLPAPPRTALLYTLSGDPQANNLNRRRVRVRKKLLTDLAQQHEFVLPASSVYLFVVDTTAD